MVHINLPDYSFDVEELFHQELTAADRMRCTHWAVRVPEPDHPEAKPLPEADCLSSAVPAVRREAFPKLVLQNLHLLHPGCTQVGTDQRSVRNKPPQWVNATDRHKNNFYEVERPPGPLTAAVRCCSRRECESICCHGHASFQTAFIACTALNMSLCTAELLQSGNCCKKGCGFDSRLVWARQ